MNSRFNLQRSCLLRAKRNTEEGRIVLNGFVSYAPNSKTTRGPFLVDTGATMLIVPRWMWSSIPDQKQFPHRNAKDHAVFGHTWTCMQTNLYVTLSSPEKSLISPTEYWRSPRLNAVLLYQVRIGKMKRDPIRKEEPDWALIGYKPLLEHYLLVTNRADTTDVLFVLNREIVSMTRTFLLGENG